MHKKCVDKGPIRRHDVDNWCWSFIDCGNVDWNDMVKNRI
jgi:hypothetical protein